MGLLEDAIREHLELKRLRGADPAEVAREQREVLEPRAGEAPAALVDDHARVDEDGTDAAGHAPAAELATAGDEHVGDVPQAPVASDLSHTGQETAELDMKAVMAEEPAMEDEHSPPEGSDMHEGQNEPSSALAEEDSLEWEVPARSHDAEAESGEQDVQDHDGTAGTARGDDATQGPADEAPEGRADAQENAPGQGRLSL
jgi:hypothetical protein